MAYADVVCTSEENATASASSPDLEGQSGNSSIRGEGASSRQEVETDGLLLIRQALSKTGLSNQPIEIILDSWRVSTKKQYLCYIHKWLVFAEKPSISALEPDITHVLEFLNSLFDAGLKYSGINTARSALSMFLGITAHDHVGKHPLVIRFMKGIASRRPSLPRYSSIWDVGLVFDMFKQQPLVQFLSLYDLTLRTVMLLALVSAQRGQSLHLLDINLMTVTDEAYTFLIMGDFKQSRKGHENLKITLNAFKDDVRLCIVNTLTVYLERTAALRNSSKLFISVVTPHNAVSKDTISRWLKSAMQLAGIDIDIFKPHSTRAAATSAAHRQGVPMADILSTADWASQAVFARFYNKPLQHRSDKQFADAILRL